MPTNRDQLLRICRLVFGEGRTFTEVARQLNRDFHGGFNRQRIIPELFQARSLGLVRLNPALDERRASELAEKFGLDQRHIHVANVDDSAMTNPNDRWAGVHVAAVAANVVMDQIKDLRVERLKQPDAERPIGLGLGPGRATLEFSRQLSERLRTDPEAPELKLIAICGGCDPAAPQFSPSSFFNLFPADLVKSSVGLFAEPLVPNQEFESIKHACVGIREAFAARTDVDIVVTGMGDFQDPHDLLTTFLKSANVAIKENWVGNVQYRPYSSTAPVLQSAREMRAVTLFELADFVDMAAAADKRVVLMARICGVCGKTRAAALRPLLTEAPLKVWTDLVIDSATADELLASSRQSDPADDLQCKPSGGHQEASDDDEQRKALTFWICDAFLNRRKSVADIVSELAAAGIHMHREAIYPRLAKAGKLGLVDVVEPLEQQLVAAIAERYAVPKTSIRVIDPGPNSNGGVVAAGAAELVMGLAKDVQAGTGKRVCLGLGPGRTTLDFSIHLGELLQADPNPPQFDLIATSAGCDPDFPAFASESFFNLFPKAAVGTNTGLFTETMVTQKEFRRIRAGRTPGAMEAFAKRDEIDIVVTAMGDFDDPHDLLRMLFEKASIERDPSWVGSMHYRPFTSSRPVAECDGELRAVTLFELDDFRCMAERKDKYVVLIGRQCKLCRRTRARALKPLLTEKALKVWSHLVIDVATARELVRRPSSC